MSKQRRDEDKRRRRQKRQEKRQARDKSSEKPELPGDSDRILRSLKQQLNVPEPRSWPGGCDPSLVRPDLVKADLGQFATERLPGREKLRQLEAGLKKGLIEFLPELHAWAMEEFLWHGLPGDAWQPIDAYLAQAGDRYPPAAAQQLRLWKEARLGIFEVGAVVGDTVLLREYDPVQGTVSATPMRAVTLNIGGVNVYRGRQGNMQLTYLAPWVPAENLFCGLGFGTTVPRELVGLLLPFLGLRHPEAVCRPLPWYKNPTATQEYLREWRHREWQGWLEERVTTPFLALIPTRPDKPHDIRQVNRLLPSPADLARQFGVYFEVEHTPGDVLIAGATSVTPLDVTSANRLALAEYHAYRQKSGPPPGTVGMPTFRSMGPR